MSVGRDIPRWVKSGTFDEAEDWPDDAPQRGDTLLVRVDFTADLETGDGEEWSSALMQGRASQTDELTVSAMVSPTSKLAPKKLLGFWDVTLVRPTEDEPWQLSKMTRRHG